MRMQCWPCRGVPGRAWWALARGVGEGAGLRIAGVFLSVGRGGGRGGASGGGSGLGVSTPLAAQDGTIIAKLRPKEDSDCRSFWSSASAQIRSRQEGEDKLEPAFQVESPQAIGRRAM